MQREKVEEMKTTAKLQIAIAIAMLMILAGSAAFGAAIEPTRNISATPHNLSVGSPSTGTYKSAQVQELCVFCHTPHNANINRALWNHSNPDPTGLTYHMYTTGADLTSVTKQVTAPKAESLMCLSCHDGRTALNVVHSAKMASGANPIIVNGKTMYQLDINSSYTDGISDGLGLPDPQGYRMGSFGPYDMIPENNTNLGAIRTYDANGNFVDTGDILAPYAGTEFGDDHPISMSYDNVLSERQSKNPSNPGLVDPGNDPTQRLALIKFYGTNRRVECGSCHDPHVTYYYNNFGVPADAQFAPFLRKTNAGSELCLSCHDK